MEMSKLISFQESTKNREITPHIYKIKPFNNKTDGNHEIDLIEATSSYESNLKTTFDSEQEHNFSKIFEFISEQRSESESGSPARNISIQNIEGKEHGSQDPFRLKKTRTNLNGSRRCGGAQLR